MDNFHFHIGIIRHMEALTLKSTLGINKLCIGFYLFIYLFKQKDAREKEVCITFVFFFLFLWLQLIIGSALG